ncbi:uncharacterized protein LOC132749772 isoform X1 [Ruditapes philippinarum]|uniref:uncharacterized protein LOC132749772 isoform X1 n=1 Tax=Ruditapes philippinarum TaxID=129788 RepID=UPI00295BB9FE|nr:uncharacterized protein LOC132749772 isoform X1 [Ruditapes philippinarum]
MTLPSLATASKTPIYFTTRYRLYHTGVYSLNSTFINRYSDVNSRSSIRIHADYPISVSVVYSYNKNSPSYDLNNHILPVNILSTSYVIPSYSSNSQNQLLVVALNESTTIHIKHYGISKYESLHANETFIYQSSSDISGASITSNRPVAVFSSMPSGYNYHSSTYKSRNLLMQVPPITQGSFHFIVPALPSLVKNYKVRIYSTHTGALVDIHSSSESVRHMHVYENIYYEYSTKGSSALEIFSDSPIMVVQIAENSYGAAMFMTNIPAVSQYMTSYLTFSTHSHYVVIVRYEEALGLLVDGSPLLHNPEVVAHSTPMGNFTLFTIPSTSSNDVVSHISNEPFGLFVFNQGSITSYSAGMNFDIDCVQPTSASQIIG